MIWLAFQTGTCLSITLICIAMPHWECLTKEKIDEYLSAKWDFTIYRWLPCGCWWGYIFPIHVRQTDFGLKIGDYPSRSKQMPLDKERKTSVDSRFKYSHTESGGSSCICTSTVKKNPKTKQMEWRIMGDLGEQTKSTKQKHTKLEHPSSIQSKTQVDFPCKGGSTGRLSEN